MSAATLGDILLRQTLSLNSKLAGFPTKLVTQPTLLILYSQTPVPNTGPHVVPFTH